MAVFVDMLASPKKQEQEWHPPKWSQATFARGFPTQPEARFSSSYFMLENGGSGADVEWDPIHTVFRVTPLNASRYWLVYRPWELAWMHLEGYSQMAQMGLVRVPDNGGLVSCMVVCNTDNMGDAYALTASPSGTAGRAEIRIERLKFGQSLGFDPGSVNPPERTTLLTCGTVSSWWDYETAGVRGGALLKLQASNAGDHWELAVWVWDNFYASYEGQPGNFELRGHVLDDELRAGVPGFGFANLPGITEPVESLDWYSAYVTEPWSLDQFPP